MAEKIVQTAGRKALGEFAPEFAHLFLNFYCQIPFTIQVKIILFPSTVRNMIIMHRSIVLKAVQSLWILFLSIKSR